MKPLNIAIVGATGLVGSTIISILEQRGTSINNVYLYASKKSAGKSVYCFNKDQTIIELTKENILDKEIDYALFSAGAETSIMYAPFFTKINATVIDNSSAFRVDKTVPLIVPEVNMEDAFTNVGIIANPNCSTIQSVLPLSPIDKVYGIKSINYTTFQAVSGSGLKGINDLERTRNNVEPLLYPHPIHNNCLPHIDRFLDNGYTYEEMKMIFETKKILNNQNILISATCVRVPVENSHSVEMSIELENEFNIEDVRELLRKTEGIKVEDDVQNNIYPLASKATNSDIVFVGRIRRDISNSKKMHLFCTADNIRKGAALNAIQIMEKLEERSDYNV